MILSFEIVNIILNVNRLLQRWSFFKLICGKLWTTCLKHSDHIKSPSPMWYDEVAYAKFLFSRAYVGKGNRKRDTSSRERWLGENNCRRNGKGNTNFYLNKNNLLIWRHHDPLSQNWRLARRLHFSVIRRLLMKCSKILSISPAPFVFLCLFGSSIPSWFSATILLCVKWRTMIIDLDNVI